MNVDSKTIWRRRFALMVVVGLLVAVPVTIAVRGDGGDEPDLPPAIEVPELGAVEFNRELGVEVRLPDDWRKRSKKGVLELRALTGGATIAISAPAKPDEADALHDDALATLRRDYKRAEVLQKAKRTRIGGLKGTATALAAKQPGKRGEPIRILLNTAKGDKRSYLVLVFAVAPNPGSAIVDAQAVLNEIRLVG